MDSMVIHSPNPLEERGKANENQWIQQNEYLFPTSSLRA